MISTISKRVEEQIIKYKSRYKKVDQLTKIKPHQLKQKHHKSSETLYQRASVNFFTLYQERADNLTNSYIK